MNATTTLLARLVATIAFFLRDAASVPAQGQLPDAKHLTSQSDIVHAGADEPISVVRDQALAGSFFSADARLERISGRVKVLNAHTLVFNDGTEVELNGGMDAPELEQKGVIGGAFYPCGKEAAEFL